MQANLQSQSFGPSDMSNELMASSVEEGITADPSDPENLGTDVFRLSEDGTLPTDGTEYSFLPGSENLLAGLYPLTGEEGTLPSDGTAFTFSPGPESLVAGLSPVLGEGTDSTDYSATLNFGDSSLLSPEAIAGVGQPNPFVVADGETAEYTAGILPGSESLLFADSNPDTISPLASQVEELGADNMEVALSDENPFIV